MKIYVTYGISCKKLTKEDLELRYKIHQLEHPDKKAMSFEAFLHLLSTLDLDKFQLEIDDIAYYDDFQKADNDIRNDKGSIYEAGEYPYAALLAIEEGAIYSRICTTEEDVTLYKYDRESKQYVAVLPSSKEYQEDKMWEIMNVAVRSR